MLALLGGPPGAPASSHGMHTAQHSPAGALQLAEMYWEGLGMPANCTAAQEYLTTFLEERAPWRDDIEAAVAALDAGNAWAALLRMAQVRLCSTPGFGGGRCL